MDEDYKSQNANNAPTSKEENFEWSEGDNEYNNSLKQLYIKYPFEKWKNILKIDFSDTNIKEGPAYQKNVCQILQEDVFKGENFCEETSNSNIIESYIQEELKTNSNIKIFPDFIVKNIKSEKFMDIVKTRNYMFRNSSCFKIPKEYEYVTIIGEVKINPNLIKRKKKQKQNYIDFRDDMNKIQTKVYFIVMYVYDYSFSNFWKKKSIEETNFIICYIPQMFKSKYFEIYEKLKGSDPSFKPEKKTKQNFSDIIKQFPIQEFKDNDDIFIENKIKKLFEIIDNHQKNEDVNTNFEKIKIEEEENNNLKNMVKDWANLYKQQKKCVEKFRKSQDELLRKKREREDKDILLKREEEDKKLLDPLNFFETLINDVINQRKNENNNCNN